MNRDLTKIDLSCNRYNMKQLPPNGLKVLDTFCGAGIGEAGMRLAGYETTYAFDIKEYAVKSYNYNYGKKAGYPEDIAHVKDVRFLTKKDFPSKIDVVTGGFPCFVEGTLVFTKYGFKNIEDIKKGDKVLTHRNRFREVVIPMKNKVDHIYRVKTDCSEDLLATEEHPFYVRRKIKKKRKNVFRKPEWIPVKDLNSDYYIGIAINNESEIPYFSNPAIDDIVNNKDFWWITGKYFKDGYIVNKETFKEIIISYTTNKELNILKYIFSNLFKVSSIEIEGSKVIVRNKSLIDFFLRFEKEKALNGIILNLPKNLLKYFLDGYLGKEIAYIESKEIAYGIGHCIAKAYNLPYTLRYSEKESKYHIKVGKNEAFYENGYIWYPLNSVKKENFDGYVYNFEVSDDNSYTVNNIIVHNCQAFSTAGAGRGSKDKELGDLGLHFCRLVKEIKPKAFLLENVGGLINKNHRPFFFRMMMELRKSGYILSMPLKTNKKGEKVLTTINCWEYGVPQTRERIFVVGIRKDIGKKFIFPDPIPEEERTNIRHAIGDLPNPDKIKNHEGYEVFLNELPFIDMMLTGGSWKNFFECEKNIGNVDEYRIKIDKYLNMLSQYEYFEGGYSSRYLSRNRQRQWDEPSFTIVSEGRQLPLYPEPSNYDIRRKEYYDSLGVQPPRRFTVRECLRLQTVPDWFLFPEDITLKQQYERCSGIPSLIAYKFGIEIAKLIK